MINWKKFEVLPTQNLTYVGAKFLTEFGIVTLQEDRTINSVAAAVTIRSNKHITARLLPEVLRTDQQLQLPSQLGSVTYTTTTTLPSSSMEEDLIPVRPSLRLHLLWWKDQHNLREGIPLQKKEISYKLVSYASKTAWEAYLEVRETQQHKTS